MLLVAGQGAHRVREGRPWASDAATPTRALPTSTPTRTPDGMRGPSGHAPRARSWSSTTPRARETCVGSVPPPCARSGLPPPPPPRACAATLTSAPACSPAWRAGSLVATMTTGRPPETAAIDTRAGRVVAEPGAHVEHERAQVVGRDALAGVVADEAHPADVARALHEPGRRAEHLGLLDGRDLLLGVAQAAEDAGDAVGQLVATTTDDVGELADDGRLAGEVGVGVDTDERLDAAHARADRALAEQLDDADLADARRVRADAELARPLADRHDAHALAVLLTEERHRARACVASSIAMTSAVTGRSSSSTPLMRDSISPSAPDGHGLLRAEVEAQSARGVLRARLRRGVAELVTQRLVDHVRRGVGARDGAAAGDVDLGLGVLADRALALEHRRAVHDEAGDGALDVGHLEHGAARRGGCGRGRRAGHRTRRRAGCGRARARPRRRGRSARRPRRRGSSPRTRLSVTTWS